MCTVHALSIGTKIKLRDPEGHGRQNWRFSAFKLPISQKRLKVERAIFTIQYSPIHLFFTEQVSSRNFEGFPWEGSLNDGWVGKIGDFRLLSRHISETVQDIWLKLLLITNRNVYTRFRLVSKSITLDDLERINGRYRINISSETAIFSLFTQKYVANDK